MTLKDVDIGAAKESLDALAAVLSKTPTSEAGQIFLQRSSGYDRSSGWRRVIMDDVLRQHLTQEAIENLLSLADFPVAYLTDDSDVEGMWGVAPSALFRGPTGLAKGLPRRMGGIPLDPVTDRLEQFGTQAIVLGVGPKPETLHVFSRRQRVKVLRGKKFGVFDLEARKVREITGDVLEVSSAIDFIHWRDHFYVANLRAFEGAADFDEVVKEGARAACAKLCAMKKIRISNFDEVERYATDSKEFARKLATAFVLGALDKPNPARIRRCIREFSLPVETSEVEGVLVLKPDLSDRTKRGQFVDMIAENFFRGAMSGEPYKALRKAPLSLL